MPLSTIIMPSVRHTVLPRRALVAALALYALMVQALLAGFAPASAAPVAFGEVLCQHEGTANGSPGVPQAAHGLCCLVACASAGAVGAAPAVLASVAFTQVGRGSAAIKWSLYNRVESVRLASAAFEARGPPVL
jgi:hypothetical protein